MIKSKKVLFGFLIFVLSILIVGFVERFAKYAAEKVYPDLIAPYDTEAPATTNTYPASTSIKAVIGGKGEGLSCSVPWLLEKMMFSKSTLEAPLSLQLRQACVRHDYCYRHGWATYGYQQVGCDFELQQDAYRICRLISHKKLSNKNSFHEDCLSRARRVLLGVRFGGGDPFQESEKSSYFEYDTMPVTADDYVVLRWIENSALTTNELCVTMACLRGNFLSLHFNRGSVVAKKLDWDGVHNGSTFKSKPILFPDTYISTPPNIIFDGAKDRLISVARKGYKNTVFNLVEYQFSETNEYIFSPKKIKVSPIDASIFGFDLQNNQLALSYWSHTIKHGIYELKDNVDASLSEKSKPILSDSYRTLAHKPLSGNFFEAGKRVTLILKRGGSAKMDEPNSGENYKGYLHLIALRPNSDDNYQVQTGDIITIKASEVNEPLVKIKNYDGRDLLMNMSVSEDGIVQFNIFDLLSCKNRNFQTSNHIACEPTITKGLKDNKNKNINKSWVRQPLQLVAPRNRESSPLIFLSKVESICDNNLPCGVKTITHGNMIKGFKYSFGYSKLGKNEKGVYEVSQFLAQNECNINIHVDELIDSEKNLVSTLKLALSPKLRKKRFKSYSEEGKKEITKLVSNEFYERWANAQVIPGWFFKTDIPTDTNSTLDVAVFFRGYTSYSFLVANGLSINDRNKEKKVFYTSESMKSFFDVKCKN